MKLREREYDLKRDKHFRGRRFLREKAALLLAVILAAGTVTYMTADAAVITDAPGIDVWGGLLLSDAEPDDDVLGDAVQSEAAPNNAIQENNAAQNDGGGNDTAQNGGGKGGASQSAPAQNDGTQGAAGQSDTVQNDGAQGAAAQIDGAQDGAVQDGAAQDNAVQETGNAAYAELTIGAPSGLLMEASTGQIIFEKDADTRRSPASVTKIMTMLLTFEALERGKISLDDEVVTSAYAQSMGGSQVFLEEGEVQTVETLIKCVVIASGNDASVALAEHIAGSEEAFVAMMNQKAQALGMDNTHFEDCCGLTASDNHYTTARDIAVMSRELITKYPQVFDYTTIWMEDITHTTARGSAPFTLSSTNRLLKQYEWATGLKTGSTSKAKYCLSATASKDGIDLIAVVMAAPDYKVRFEDAIKMLNYGYAVSNFYVDPNQEPLDAQSVDGGIKDTAALKYSGEFRYLDIESSDLSTVEKQIHLPESISAPVREGDKAGEAVYFLNGRQIGMVDILFAESVETAAYKDYLRRVFKNFLL